MPITLEQANRIWAEAGCDKRCYIDPYTGKLRHQWNCKVGLANPNWGRR